MDQGVRGHFAFIERATPMPSLGIQGHYAQGDPRRLALASRAQREASTHRYRAGTWHIVLRLGFGLFFPPLLLVELISWLGRMRWGRRSSRGLGSEGIATAQVSLSRLDRARSATVRDHEIARRHHIHQRRLKALLYAMCLIPLAGYLTYAIIHGGDALVHGAKGEPIRVINWVVVYTAATALLLGYDLLRLAHERRRRASAAPSSTAS